MKNDSSGLVHVRGAREHNLKDIDLDIPRDVVQSSKSRTAPYLARFLGISDSGDSEEADPSELLVSMP